MKKVLTAIVTFIFGVCLISATVATASAASVKKVTNFKASATPVAVTLTWKKASGAKGYEIQQKSGKKWKAVATIKKANTTTYTVKKLKNGTTYQFRIRAVNGKKKSAYVSVKVKTGVQKITSVKAASTGLKSAKLTWAKANVTGYEIQQKNGKKWKTIKKIKKAKTVSATVSKLAAGAQTTFRIRGYVNGSAKTYYGSYTTVKVTTAVAPMKNLSVSAVTETSATVSWGKLSGVSGYQVQKLQSGKWVDVNKAVKNSVTKFTLSGLSAFSEQQIRVRAYQKDGKKTFYNAWATVKAKTLMGSVSGVSYSNLKAGSVRVSWKAAGGAAGYRVFNNGKQIADVKTAYADLKLTAATNYKITVAPYNGSTVGAATAPVSFTSACAKITGVKATSIADTSVSVSWGAVSGAQSYHLQYSKDGKNWTTVNLTGTSYTIINLSPNTEYQVRVNASNKNGSTTQYGDYSDTIKAKTSGCSSVSTANGATISWKEVSGAQDYVVEYYDVSTGEWTAKETVKDTKASVNDLSANKAGLYRVVAYGSNKNDPLYTSEGVTATASGYSVVKDAYKVTISWPAKSGASSYKVVRFTQDGYEEEKTTSSSVRSITMTVAPGVIHQFKIIAIVSGSENVLSHFAVETTKLNAADKTDNGINSQLLYLVEAINRTKFEKGNVTVKATPYNLTEVKYVDFGFKGANEGLLAGVKTEAVHGLLNFMFENPADKYSGCKLEGGFLKCTDAKAIDGVFAGKDANGNIIESMAKNEISGTKLYSFVDGESGVNKLWEVVQPINEDSNGMAYLYNSENASAWKNGFSKVETVKTKTGYKISATLKEETGTNYHDGFVEGASIKDMGDLSLGGTGNANLNSKVGQTVIVAEISDECFLTSYSIESPYKYDMNVEVSLSSDQMGGDSEPALDAVLKLFENIVIEMNTKVEGVQRYNYTFVR